MKFYRSKSLGVTLIELLFVIVIIAVLVSLPMTTFKRVAQQTKIEKAAMQMQQILQGGMSYYVQNRCWPGDTSSPSSCLSSPPPAFDAASTLFAGDQQPHYIPLNGTVSPWGNSYKWVIRGGSFEVQVETPSPAIAQRLAGMLPNAQVGPVAGSCADSSCVLADVSPAILRPKFTLVAVGRQEMDAAIGTSIGNGTSQTLTSVNCPPGSRGFKTIISIKSFLYNSSYFPPNTLPAPYKISALLPLYLSAGETTHLPITVKSISFDQPTYYCAKTGGFIDYCITTVSLNHATGVVCGIWNSSALHPHVTSGLRHFSCTDASNGEGEYSMLNSISYDYRSYCCATSDCS